MLRRLLVTWLCCAGPLLAHAACSATNGETPPEPLYTPPDGSDEEQLVPDATTGTSKDAGVDAKAEASADAKADAAAPTSESVRIQELYVDHDGLGDGAEYVELRGAPGTPVGDLSLRLIDAAGKVAYDVPVTDTADDVIGSSGTWVVAGTQTFQLGVVERIDHTVPLVKWGIANNRGAVQLVRGANRDLLDVVGYVTDPDAGAATQPSTTPKATSEGVPAVVPTIAKRALGRKAAATDTDQNRADFCSMVPSPGMAQKACD